MSERCALSDLPLEQCACRIHAEPTEFVDAPMPEHPFLAKFAARCPACDGRIHEGDLICRTTDGDYVHEECR